jgi:hypothetical protein
MRIYVRLRKDTVVRRLWVVAESVGDVETETLDWLAVASVVRSSKVSVM